MRIRVHVLGAVVTGVLAASLPQGSARADGLGAGCPDEQMTDQGVCADPLSSPLTDPLTTEQLTELTEKEAAYQQFDSPQGTPGSGGSGGTYRMPEVVNMTIWKEGQGNNRAYWTCGPSATRNMVAAMWKHKNGVYKDFGEQQIAVWEGTTKNAGTSSAAIRHTLNTHFSQFGSWKTVRPVDPDHYLSRVAVDSYQYHQPVIVNVDTEKLTFWNGHIANHFNFDFGWDSTDSNNRTIAIAEEYDSTFIHNGVTPDYGNPYGRHLNEPLVNAYRAVINTSYHYMIV